LQCVAACKEGAIRVVDAEPIIDWDLCARCGDCAAACPTGSLVVEKKGFTILVGGKLGRHPKLAEKLVELADEETVYEALSACIELIEEEGQRGERLGTLLERVGIERLHEKLKSRQTA
jgi:dissimilatory sulfite reductase (desulfoviridin) alpha/beta subunit